MIYTAKANNYVADERANKPSVIKFSKTFLREAEELMKKAGKSNLNGFIRMLAEERLTEAVTRK